MESTATQQLSGQKPSTSAAASQPVGPVVYGPVLSKTAREYSSASKPDCKPTEPAADEPGLGLSTAARHG